MAACCSPKWRPKFASLSQTKAPTTTISIVPLQSSLVSYPKLSDPVLMKTTKIPTKPPCYLHFSSPREPSIPQPSSLSFMGFSLTIPKLSLAKIWTSKGTQILSRVSPFSGLLLGRRYLLIYHHLYQDKTWSYEWKNVSDVSSFQWNLFFFSFFVHGVYLIINLGGLRLRKQGQLFCLRRQAGEVTMLG